MISHGPSQPTFQTNIPKPWSFPHYNPTTTKTITQITNTFNTFRPPEKMDESWRMRMGTPATKQHNDLPPRRSTEDTNRPNNVHGYEALDPEDFDDVFGGPPRSVLSRQYSVEGDFARTASVLFEDIFRKPRSDRTLPEFRIPESRTGGGRRRTDEEFYSDIFGNSRRSRSRSKSHTNSNSKSKSNSSSILSSEELSPFRPAVVDDDDVSFSSFASKLRPINVSSTSKKTHEMTDIQLDSPCDSHSYESDYIHKFKGCYSGFTQMVSSPEIASFGPNSYKSVKESTEDLQVNSPASIVSSLNHEHEDETTTIHDEDDDEVLSSYIIEINPSNRERIGASIGIDDAIAWAKQKCQTRNLEENWNNKREIEEDECHQVDGMPDVNNVLEEHIARNGSRISPLLDKQKECTAEEPLQELEEDVSPCKQMEVELLDDDIKLWSDGKVANIRLLLSTLHHILWPSSGWIMVPLTNLKDSSHVKKAYQKARLCLHPDKLQQRGATISQKYVAEKAFPILQDAWAAFISQDIRSSIT